MGTGFGWEGGEEMSKIKISNDLYRVYISTEEGWKTRIGHIATINGLECSLIPEKADWGIRVVVSEISSGGLLYREWVDPFSYASCNTKEKTLVLLQEVAENAASFIDKYSIEFLNERIVESLEKMTELHGPMPKNKILLRGE